MKIAVCVKSVPNEAEMDPATNRLDQSGEAVLNPFDEHAVEEALRLGGEGVEVVVVSLSRSRRRRYGRRWRWVQIEPFW